MDVARSLRGVGNLQVLSGLNAAFRELQMTLKPGRNEPWADKRVRQAVNFAINRQQIIQNVYSGEAAYTSYVPPGYGPWPLSEADLKRKYAKFDLPAAKKLMADAGASRGFSVDMTIVNLQDYPSVAALLVQQMKQINIDLNVKGTEIGTFASIYNAGSYDWFLNGRGMRGDVDGFVQEFHPASATFKAQTPAYRNLKAWKRDRERPHPAQRCEAAADVPRRPGGPLGRSDPDAARGDPEVPGVQPARPQHVRRLQRLQHRLPRGVAGVVAARGRVCPGGASRVGAPPQFARSTTASRRSRRFSELS